MANPAKIFFDRFISDELQYFVSQAHIIREQFIELFLVEFQQYNVRLYDKHVCVNKVGKSKHLANELTLSEF